MPVTKQTKYTSIKTVLDAMLASTHEFTFKLATDWLGERVIIAASSRSQIYLTSYGRGAGLYFCRQRPAEQPARERWHHVRKALVEAGCELVQWGVNVGEGAVRFDPADKKQLAAVLEVLK